MLDSETRRWHSATMLFALKVYKSAGVPVTRGVHRLIARGNRARDARQWHRASEAYRMALARDPSLHHIWVQFAHMLREDGQLLEAEKAYEKAQDLGPDKAEPLVYLGHMARSSGQDAQAAHFYMLAAQAEPANANGADELARILASRPGKAAEDLRSFLRRRAGDQQPARQPLPNATMSLVVDVSALAELWRRGRVPDALQRQQIAIVNDLCLAPGARVTLVCMTVERNDWVEVAPDVFRDVAAACREGTRPDEPRLLEATARLGLALMIAGPLDWPVGAIVLGFGGSGMPGNHALSLRDARRTHGARYWPFLIGPGVEPGEMRWLLDVLDEASGVLVASNALAVEVEAAASQAGRSLPPGNVVLVGSDCAAAPAIMEAASGLSSERGTGAVGPWPHVLPGHWYSLRSDATGIPGERFRAGLGWRAPDSGGCWTGPEGGELVIPLPEVSGALRLYLELRGLPSNGSHYRLKIENQPAVEGFIRATQRKWVTLDVSADRPDGVLRMFLRGEHLENAPVGPPDDERVRSVAVGLIGFCMIGRDDVQSRSAMLEAIALDDPPSLNDDRAPNDGYPVRPGSGPAPSA